MAHNTPGTLKGQRAPRESNTSSPRPSYSRNTEESFQLKTVYPPASSTKFEASVDIIAVHGLTEGADLTWSFSLPTRPKDIFDSMSGKRDPFVPGVDTITESSVAAKNVFVSGASKVYKYVPKGSLFPEDPPEDTSKDTLNDNPKETRNQNSSKAPSIQSSNDPMPESPRKVNWLKDENMLPRSFPQARIMQFHYPSFVQISNTDTTDSALKLVATELLQRLSDERKGITPGLSRPIVFIGHSFGGLVISKALIIAEELKFSDIANATVGLLFLGTPFKGSMPVVARLHSKWQRWRSPFAPSNNGQQSPNEGDFAEAATYASPRNVGAKPLYPLLDSSTNNAKILESMRKDLITTARTYNVRIACFYERHQTTAARPFPKEILVKRESAVLETPEEVDIGLSCTHTNLSKFQSSVDPNFMLVKRVIKDYIDFTTTRRLWGAISISDQKEVNELLINGANVNEMNSQKQNALHLATEAGNLDIVKLILATGVEVNAKDVDQHTPIRSALLMNKEDIVLALLRRCAVLSKEDKEGEDGKLLPLDGRCQELLNSVHYYPGPSKCQKKREARPRPDEINPPEQCGNIRGTITTFFFGNKQKMSIDMRGDDPDEDEDEREYRVEESIPLSKMLSTGDSQSLKENTLSDKGWKWYHLPANNMDWVEALFAGLGIDNEQGKLSGQEHRGRFPHTLFLQPRARVSKGETFLFMPYLHFETNEGRIRLSNAIRRAATSSAQPENSEGAKNTVAQSEWIPSDKPWSPHHDDDYSDYDSDEYQPKGKAEQKAEKLKENYRCFKRAIRRYRAILDEESTANPLEDDVLIKTYLAEKSPGKHGNRLHIRRTLDQFYYIGLPSTENRDTNQVVQRYAMKDIDASRVEDKYLLQTKLIMVDQLWLWIIGENTIITCFPQGWGQANSTKDNHDGVLQQIQLYLRGSDRQPITGVEDLAAVIIKECTRLFGRSEVPKPELDFLDVFDSSIIDVVDRYSRLLAKLDVGWDEGEYPMKGSRESQKEDSKRAKRKNKINAKRRKELKMSQLNINEDVDLLVEIQDIEDELKIIKMVLDDQLRVLLGDNHQHSPPSTNDPKDKQDSSSGNSKSKQEQSEEANLQSILPDLDGTRLYDHINTTREAVSDMIRRAEDVYKLLSHLIDLKQKQASVAEARYARKEAKSAAKEGKTILALTVVNMIFLPLSFMSSFFSLDIVEFPKDSTTGENALGLRWVSQYIFGVSMAVAIPSIALALAIGPWEKYTRILGGKLASWGLIWGSGAIRTILATLLILLIFALIPVAIALGIAGLAVIAAAFIVYLLAFIVFNMCEAIWKCTPYYQNRKKLRARKLAKHSDPEHVVPEVNITKSSTRGGEDVRREETTEKRTMVVEAATVEEGSTSQHEAGKDPAIKEIPQQTLAPP